MCLASGFRNTVLHHTVLYQTVLYQTVLNHIISYYTSQEEVLNLMTKANLLNSH